MSRYKKIDIFEISPATVLVPRVTLKYVASTNMSRTCKEAVAKMEAANHSKKYKATWSK